MRQNGKCHPAETGLRRLVRPRVPTGGGALYGKDLSHIDPALAWPVPYATPPCTR